MFAVNLVLQVKYKMPSGHTYAKKRFVVYLKFKHNWMFVFLSLAVLSKVENINKIMKMR